MRYQYVYRVDYGSSGFHSCAIKRSAGPLFAAPLLAVVLAACDLQGSSKSAVQEQELASINERVTALEQRSSSLEQAIERQKQSIGKWTLWQVNEAFNAGYPQALSAYESKVDCLSATMQWDFPGGTVVGEDPKIFQLKGYRIRLECLPVGTTPYAH